MSKYRRIFTIVMDSLGVGALPDAAEYGDVGTDTLGHISQSMDTFHIPNLQKIGMANLHPLKQVAPVENPLGYYAYLHEASTGKDTMTGHWEMMGIHTTTPFNTFSEHGFPPELIAELEKRMPSAIEALSKALPNVEASIKEAEKMSATVDDEVITITEKGNDPITSIESISNEGVEPKAVTTPSRTAT